MIDEDDSANIRNTPIYDMAMESSRHIIVDYQNKMQMHIHCNEGIAEQSDKYYASLNRLPQYS